MTAVATQAPPVRVMIVDDSAVVRQVLSALLGADRGIEVVATASDPVFARRSMEACWPDVIVLDVEMPRMDGISFLRSLMAERPTPVVICSSLTTKGAETTMAAMAAGAVAVFPKPTSGVRGHLEAQAADLVAAVKAAAAADPCRLRAMAHAPTPVAVAGEVTPPARPRLTRTTDRIVAVGTSTGGTQALEAVLRALPRLDAGMVVVQHMPERFTAAFAARLDSCCAADVSEAVDGDRVRAGRVLIAPGGRHMQVVRDGAQYRVKVTDGPRVNRHKPSVDVLFRSVAATAGANALGVILTGMGDDGAAGLLAMRRAGARTVGQDEATCVVYGMPAAAKAAGAVVDEVPLQQVPRLIHRFTDEER